VEEMK